MKNRHVSSRLDDSRSAATQFNSPEEYYRKQYFKFLDSAISSVNSRSSQPGMDLACKMESVLLGAATGKETDVDDITLVNDFYGDLDKGQQTVEAYFSSPVSWTVSEDESWDGSSSSEPHYCNCSSVLCQPEPAV